MGSEVFKELNQAGHKVFAPSHSELDITDENKMLDYVQQISPEAVINCAGFTRVDDCERHQKLAFEVNARGAENLAKASNKVGALMVQISTDYVFSGKKLGEYLEEDEPAPLNIYGRSKLEGERAVMKFSGKWLIIRTSWLFGRGGENFIQKILKRWQEGAVELKIVSDERGRPTYAPDLARAIRLLVERGLKGIYHFANKGIVSWFELAGEVFELIGDGPRLIPIKAEEFGLPARRPKNSALSTKKIEEALGIDIRHHQSALKDYLTLLGLYKD